MPTPRHIQLLPSIDEARILREALMEWIEAHKADPVLLDRAYGMAMEIANKIRNTGEHF